MRSGKWVKRIYGKLKTKKDISKQAQGSAHAQSFGIKLIKNHIKSSIGSHNGSCRSQNMGNIALSSEEVASIQIQTAFRGYQARKILCQLKGSQKMSLLSDCSVKRQTSTTLHLAQSWSKIQAEIRARRASMAAKGRIKQRRHESQVKLEAKLRDLQVEWCGGAETMEEILLRINQREEAVLKRERAMAYAFSHQWRANPSVFQGHPYEIGNGNWGWSWTERWIAVRPWEMRISSPCKTQSDAANKKVKKRNPPMKFPEAKNPAILRDEKAHDQEQAPLVATQTCDVLQ